MAKCMTSTNRRGTIWWTLFSIPLKGREEFDEKEIEGRSI